MVLNKVVDINLEMVKAGLAEVYRGNVPKKFNLLPYWQAEKEAREDKRGMWSLGNEYGDGSSLLLTVLRTYRTSISLKVAVELNMV